jgi:hypothetical protein
MAILTNWLRQYREKKYRRWVAEGRVCGAMSGLFVGYPCDLLFGHADRKHRATTSRTIERGREVGRSTIVWTNNNWVAER